MPAITGTALMVYWVRSVAARSLSVGRGITLSGEVNSCDKLFIAHRPSSYRAVSHSLGHNAVI
jgi:hypothetical protein